MNHDIEESRDDTGNPQTTNNESNTDRESEESKATSNVLGITIQGCSQNMDTDAKESSHIDSNIAENVETDVKTGSAKSAVNDKVSGHDQSLETATGIDENNVDTSPPNTASELHKSRSNQDATNKKACTGLSADSISITDRHHEISNTTASLVKKATNTTEQTDHGEELTDDTDREGDTETDSVMIRNIDFLHQSISNMRDEFLER